MPKPPQKPWQQKYRQQGAPMEVTDHLDELRDRLIWCLLAISLSVFLVGVPLASEVLRLIETPFRVLLPVEARPVLTLEVQPDGSLRLDATSTQMLAELPDGAPSPFHSSRLRLLTASGSSVHVGIDHKHSLFFFSPIEPVMLWMKAVMLTGFMAAFPYVLWQLWLFISPGLTEAEKLFTRRSLQAALFLFPAGVLFGWFAIGYIMYFLLQYGTEYVPAISVSSYVGFSLLFMITLGVVFELPLALLLLIRLDIIPLRLLTTYRGYIVIGVMVVAAMVTPPDPFTMVLLGLPCYLLLEITIQVARFLGLDRPAGAGAAAGTGKAPEAAPAPAAVLTPAASTPALPVIQAAAHLRQAPPPGASGGEGPPAESGSPKE